MFYLGLLTILICLLSLPQVWRTHCTVWTKVMGHLFLCSTVAVASTTLFPSEREGRILFTKQQMNSQTNSGYCVQRSLCPKRATESHGAKPRRALAPHDVRRPPLGMPHTTTSKRTSSRTAPPPWISGTLPDGASPPRGSLSTTREGPVLASPASHEILRHFSICPPG